MGFIFILLTGICWAALGVCYSKGAEKGSAFYAFLFIGSLTFTGLIWGGATPSPAPYREVLTVAAIMLPAGFAGQFGFLAMRQAMAYGYHGVGWCIVQSAMLCPFAAGMLFFGDRVTVTRLTGMLLLAASLALLGTARHSHGTGRYDLRRFLLRIAPAFALVGLGQALSLLPSQLALSPEALSWRVPLYSLSGVTWLILLFANGRPSPKPVWKLGILYGLLIALGQVFLYRSIDLLTQIKISGSAYPAACGSCILLFFLYCAFFRGERLSRQGRAGAALCLAGLIILAIP